MIHTPNAPFGHTDQMYSEHPGGCNVLLGDGSVRFLSTSTSVATLMFMATRDGGFNNQTIRQIVHTSIGGTAVGVQFSNLYGSDPLVIGDVRVALRASGQRTARTPVFCVR